MKKITVQIATSGSLILAALGILLVVGIVGCKTTPGQGKQVRLKNAGQADTNKSEGRFYTCAMHPEVRSLDPDGKCPICQMPLFPAEDVTVVDPVTGKTNSAATFPVVSGYYSCPLHPTVLSTNADDHCPICGMALVPVESPVFIRKK